MLVLEQMVLLLAVEPGPEPELLPVRRLMLLAGHWVAVQLLLAVAEVVVVVVHQRLLKAPAEVACGPQAAAFLAYPSAHLAAAAAVGVPSWEDQVEAFGQLLEVESYSCHQVREPFQVEVDPVAVAAADRVERPVAAVDG